MKRKNWFWGTVFILLAVLLVVLQFTSLVRIGFWSIVATIVLAAILFNMISELNIAGLPLPLAFLYMVYQKPLDLPQVSGWVLIVAAVLASIGLGMLFGNLRRRRYHKQVATSPEQGTYYISQSYASGDLDSGYGSLENEQNNDDNHPFAKVRFGAASKYLHSTCLESGQFETAFGALEIYFDQAVVSPNGADLYIDCSFGAITLFVPRTWLVKNGVSTALAGVDEKSRGMPRPGPGAPELRLHGNVSLGGLEIKYV